MMDREARRASKRQHDDRTQAASATEPDARLGSNAETLPRRRTNAPASVKAQRIVLSKNMTLEQAFARVAQRCLDHLLANTDCVLECDDPEGVHQMRVALRRLRSAFRVFSEILPPDRGKELASEAKLLANRLGAARDWDVFHMDLVAPTQAAFPAERAFACFSERIVVMRRKSRAQARRALRSEVHGRFLQDTTAFLESMGRPKPVGRSTQTSSMSLTDFASRRLSKLHRCVLEAGQRFEGLTTTERHQMRIDVKRLRYACDFFASLFDDGAAKSYGAQLAQLQDALGYTNDLAVAQDLVSRLCGRSTDQVAMQCRYAGGIVVGWHGHALAASEEKLTERVKGLIEIAAFWRNGPGTKP